MGSNATPAATKPEPAAPLSPDTLLAKVKQRFPDAENVTLRFNPPLRLPMGSEPRSQSHAVSAVVRTANPWPPFGATTLTLDPHTGDVRQTETFATLSAGTRARRWIRLLHTGEAFRAPGQLVAGIACLAACVLVWTGVALAWRRFFGRGASAS
jgi:uncharacterized iron-regulated membrane protein